MENWLPFVWQRWGGPCIAAEAHVTKTNAIADPTPQQIHRETQHALPAWEQPHSCNRDLLVDVNTYFL